MASLKYSRQRESIKEFLMTRTDHPTADTVYHQLRKIYPNISLGTIYRMKEPEALAAEHFEGKILGHITNFYGICPDCLKKDTM